MGDLYKEEKGRRVFVFRRLESFHLLGGKNNIPSNPFDNLGFLSMVNLGIFLVCGILLLNPNIFV